jgi:hypothetical protein
MIVTLDVVFLKFRLLRRVGLYSFCDHGDCLFSNSKENQVHTFNYAGWFRHVGVNRHVAIVLLNGLKPGGIKRLQVRTKMDEIPAQLHGGDAHAVLVGS